jgi:hypothetical protein
MAAKCRLNDGSKYAEAQVRSIWNMALLCGVFFVTLAFGQSVEPQSPDIAESEAEQVSESASTTPSTSSSEETTKAEEPEHALSDEQADAAVSEESDEETQSTEETALLEQPSEASAETQSSEETALSDDGCEEGEDCEEPASGGAEELEGEVAQEDGSEGELLASEEEALEGEDEESTSAPKTAGVRLGVLRLESLTGHDGLASELTEAMALKLGKLGLYTLVLPEDIDSALSEKNMRMPSRCREPKCIHDVGRNLGLDRMIWGTVDRNGSRFGVRLTLIDISTSAPIESVNIQGDQGVSAEDVLSHAIDRIHGNAGEADVSKYFGPPMSNLRELMWSAAAVQVTGLFYSVLNYGTGSGRTDGIVYVPYRKEKLSGIVASADQIPIFARPAALANAYVAASDDAYGVLYNPAGLAWVAQREAAAAYQYRFGMDLIAATYVNKAARDLGFGHALLLSTDRDGIMTEMYFISAVGYKLNNTPIGPLSFGATLKTISNSVKALSLDSPKGASIGAGLDLGLMWEMSDRIRYGMLFRGVPAVNRWKNRATSSEYYEAHPATLTMGGSYRASYSSFFIAEGQIPLYEDQPWIMAGGIEYEFFRMIALRVGLQREILNEESDWWKITGGTGFKFGTEPIWGKSVALDMAYEYNTLHLFPVINASLRVGF